jgi:hypothetical protein
MLNVPLGRRRGQRNPGGAKLRPSPWISGWTNPILSLVSARLLVDIGDSRGKQIDIEVVNSTI